MVVMTSKNFRPNILEECLVQGISLPNSQSGRAPSIDSLDRLPGLQSNLDRSPIGATSLQAPGQNCNSEFLIILSTMCLLT